MTNPAIRRPILVAVAPVGAQTALPARNPLTPAAIAADVIASARAGAAMVHLHVRDADGQPTDALDAFSHTLTLIRAESDIVVQGSTGGVGTLSREARCVSLNDARVEVASLNMGSANVGETVYVNTRDDIRFWGRRMRERRIVPELEVFEVGMLTNIPRLLAEGVLAPPFHVNVCLGFDGPLPADPLSLFFAKQMLPANVPWGLIHDGMRDLTLLAAAIGLGATVVRVGFEDSVYAAPDEVAQTNADLVANIAALIRQLGCRAATPAEARQMLAIPV
jgi:3-keto-5-aminohexanoate cleavage enzyme